MDRAVALAVHAKSHAAMQVARLVLVYGCALALIAAGPHLPHFGF